MSVASAGKLLGALLPIALPSFGPLGSIGRAAAGRARHAWPRAPSTGQPGGVLDLGPAAAPSTAHLLPPSRQGARLGCLGELQSDGGGGAELRAADVALGNVASKSADPRAAARAICRCARSLGGSGGRWRAQASAARMCGGWQGGLKAREWPAVGPSAACAASVCGAVHAMPLLAGESVVRCVCGRCRPLQAMSVWPRARLCT